VIMLVGFVVSMFKLKSEPDVQIETSQSQIAD
jgi:hypothetical protein